jgi:hypothetical protein
LVIFGHYDEVRTKTPLLPEEGGQPFSADGVVGVVTGFRIRFVVPVFKAQKPGRYGSRF